MIWIFFDRRHCFGKWIDSQSSLQDFQVRCFVDDVGTE